MFFLLIKGEFGEAINIMGWSPKALVSKSVLMGIVPVIANSISYEDSFFKIISLGATEIKVLMFGFSSVNFAIILWPKYFAVDTTPTFTVPLFARLTSSNLLFKSSDEETKTSSRLGLGFGLEKVSESELSNGHLFYFGRLYYPSYFTNTKNSSIYFGNVLKITQSVEYVW